MCFFFYGGGGLSKVHCLVACCPGNKVGSFTGEQCILADQWNLCVRACMHDVFVRVDSGGEGAADEDGQDKEGQKAVVADKVTEIKSRD